ncbi:MAG: hypothetical protein M3Q65_20650 [Chloroflexota bacterium]|nr:hypothetical protein [Chloroflexota bacterium]
MGREATTCWSCDERALAVVARRRGRVVAGLCDGQVCPTHGAVDWLQRH